MSVYSGMSCGSCKKKEECEYFFKLDKIVESIYPLSGGINVLCPLYSVSILDSEEIVCEQWSSSYGKDIIISCGALKKWSEVNIKAVFKGFVYGNSVYEDDVNSGDVNKNNEDSDSEEKDEDEDCSENPLSYEDKIKKIGEILKIDNPIKVKVSNEINAYVNNDNEIYITSAALDRLDLDEIAFGIAHENAHVGSHHIKTRADLIDVIADSIKENWTDKNSFLKKLLESIKIATVGVVSYIGLNHLQEIEADIKAQQKLNEIGYGQNGGEKFFNRMNVGTSFGHPSSSMRKEVIKKIRDGR